MCCGSPTHHLYKTPQERREIRANERDARFKARTENVQAPVIVETHLAVAPELIVPDVVRKRPSTKSMVGSNKGPWILKDVSNLSVSQGNHDTRH